MTSTPIIGIPCRLDTSGTYPGRAINAQNRAYVHAVMRAGAIPILIPVEVTLDMLDTLFHQVDGLLFSGGGDITPPYYHQTAEVDNLFDIQQARDDLEIALMQLALREEKPFLAICRGIQVMNVASGGSLWQDLNSQYPQAIRHDYYYQDEHLPRNYIAHTVKLAPDSRLRHILETDQLAVNSLHHQAVKEVGQALTVAGRAEDGVIEVLEVPDHPFGIGVQWHPEELWADQAEARRLFAAFVKSARNGRI